MTATRADPARFAEDLRSAVQKVLPSVATSHLDSVVKAYAEAGENKAIAGSREKSATWRFTNRESVYAAEQSALEACQLFYANPCVLVAVNGTIASLPEDGTWVARAMSRVGYEGQFDPQQIPIVKPEVRGRKDVTDYSSMRGPKAVAIHPRGTLSIASGTADQAAAEASALKSCNDEASQGGRLGNCLLYAAGNHVVLPLRFFGPRPPARTIAEAIRLIGPARAEETYRNAKPGKALAIEPESGTWSYWDNQSSAEAAAQMALGHCQVTLGKPCVLIATDDTLVATDPPAAAPSDVDRVHAEGRYDVGKLPFLPGVSRDIVNRYAMQPMPKAMAIKLFPPRFTSASAETPAAAQRKALAECNQISGSTCMLYATGDTIVLPQRLTSPP